MEWAPTIFSLSAAGCPNQKDDGLAAATHLIFRAHPPLFSFILSLAFSFTAALSTSLPFSFRTSDLDLHDLHNLQRAQASISRPRGSLLYLLLGRANSFVAALRPRPKAERAWGNLASEETLDGPVLTFFLPPPATSKVPNSSQPTVSPRLVPDCLIKRTRQQLKKNRLHSRLSSQTSTFFFLPTQPPLFSRLSLNFPLKSHLHPTGPDALSSQVHRRRHRRRRQSRSRSHPTSDDAPPSVFVSSQPSRLRSVATDTPQVQH